MKRIFVVFYLLCSVLLFGIDFGVDFTKLDPTIFVSNMNNEYKDGYVAVTDQIVYYQKPISYSVRCNKENLNNFFVYYTFLSDDQEIFLRFFKDFFYYYSDKAIRLVVNSINTSYGYEVQFEISIPDLPPYLIYIHNAYSSGILGFGMTYSSSYNDKVDSNIKNIAMIWDNPNTIQFMYRFNLHELRTNICYYKDLDFLEDDILMIDTDKIDGWDKYFSSMDASIVRKKSNATMYTVKLIVDDESLKEDPKFLSYNLMVDYNMVVSFYDLIKEGVYKLYGNQYSRFRINIDTISKEEMIELSKKMRIVISSE